MLPQLHLRYALSSIDLAGIIKCEKYSVALNKGEPSNIIVFRNPDHPGLWSKLFVVERHALLARTKARAA